jgi:hypothetical protein
LNIGLQYSWQMYAMAVIVGFVTVMVMRWWRYRRAGAGGDSSPLSLVINNMTQGVILFDAHERILVCRSLHRDVRPVAGRHQARMHIAGADRAPHNDRQFEHRSGKISFRNSQRGAARPVDEPHR